MCMYVCLSLPPLPHHRVHAIKTKNLSIIRTLILPLMTPAADSSVGRAVQELEGMEEKLLPKELDQYYSNNVISHSVVCWIKCTPVRFDDCLHLNSVLAVKVTTIMS